MTEELVTNIINGSIETLLMTIIGTLLAYLIGFPLGVILNMTSKNGIRPHLIPYTKDNSNYNKIFE